eukprot:CFRG0034T1
MSALPPSGPSNIKMEPGPPSNTGNVYPDFKYDPMDPSTGDVAALLAANKITMDPPFVPNLDAAAYLLSLAQAQAHHNVQLSQNSVQQREQHTKTLAQQHPHATGAGFPQVLYQSVPAPNNLNANTSTSHPPAYYGHQFIMPSNSFPVLPGAHPSVPGQTVNYGHVALAPNLNSSPVPNQNGYVSAGEPNTPDNMNICSSPGDGGSRGSDKDSMSNEARRSAHIFAEQKRRNNIKVGFEELQQIIPSCQVTPNGKFSKANILQKAIDYVGYLIRQKTGLLDELDKLRKEVQQLRLIIDEYNKLGKPNEIEQRAKMFTEAVEGYQDIPDMYTKDNIKFFVFCHVVDKLFEAFNAKVSLESSEAFSKTLLEWFEQYCAPDALRETFMVSLQSMGTSLFTDESTQKFKRWGGALSACKDVMVTHLDKSRIPMAKTLGHTIDRTAGYLGATETLGVSPLDYIETTTDMSPSVKGDTSVLTPTSTTEPVTATPMR